MNFFKKIFKSSSASSKGKKEVQTTEPQKKLPLDDSFVHNFINKGGKFIYCTTIQEVIQNLKSIINENNFRELLCYDNDLLKLTNRIGIKSHSYFSKALPFFTTCEHLISNNGDILFSSNQLGSNRINEFSKNFIVYGTTSQFVKNTGEGLTSIKINFSGNIPTNISSIKNFNLNLPEDDFMNYGGNSNSKNLYLILFEDL